MFIYYMEKGNIPTPPSNKVTFNTKDLYFVGKSFNFQELKEIPLPYASSSSIVRYSLQSIHIQEFNASTMHIN